MLELFHKLATRYTLEHKRGVLKQVTAQAHGSNAYYFMAGASAVIAAYGLLANSTAVVIGAMLLAPLLGPIFGVSMGLTLGDKPLLRRALWAEFLGMGLVVALAVLIGLVPWRPEFASEIISRTQPTFYDLLVALAAGLAGTYALLDARVSVSLTGVAIATAVVPPLATCGLCLAAGQWSSALGAALLFLANFLAIQMAAALILILFGFPALRRGATVTLGSFLHRFGLSLVLLVVVSSVLIQALYTTISSSRLRTALHTVLAQAVESTDGAYLSSVDSQPGPAGLDVMAVVYTPQEFSPDEVGKIEAMLRSQVRPRIHLIVRSLISQDADAQGPVFIAAATLARRTEAAKQTALLSRVSQALEPQLSQFAGAHLVDLRQDSANGPASFIAVVRTPLAISPAEVASLEQALQPALATPPRLVVRSVITQDADAQQYLYQPGPAPAKLTGETLKVHQWLERALRNQLRLAAPVASLSDFRYAREGGRLTMLAVVRTPSSLTPQQVAAMQAALRKYADPGMQLIVRSQVGADTSASGYLASFDAGKLTP